MHKVRHCCGFLSARRLDERRSESGNTYRWRACWRGPPRRRWWTRRRTTAGLDSAAAGWSTRCRTPCSPMQRTTTKLTLTYTTFSLWSPLDKINLIHLEFDTRTCNLLCACVRNEMKWMKQILTMTVCLTVNCQITLTHDTTWHILHFKVNVAISLIIRVILHWLMWKWYFDFWQWKWLIILYTIKRIRFRKTFILSVIINNKIIKENNNSTRLKYGFRP